VKRFIIRLWYSVFVDGLPFDNEEQTLWGCLLPVAHGWIKQVFSAFQSSKQPNGKT
jgi:hypothetical protein